MDFAPFKSSTGAEKSSDSPQDVVSVKQYFAIIGVLMIVIILGINFFNSLKSGSRAEDKNDKLTELPTVGPEKTENEIAGPEESAKKSPTPKQSISTPSKAPTSTPTKTPTPTTTPTPTNSHTSTPTNTPTPSESPTPTDGPTPTDSLPLSP